MQKFSKNNKDQYKGKIGYNPSESISIRLDLEKYKKMLDPNKYRTEEEKDLAIRTLAQLTEMVLDISIEKARESIDKVYKNI